MLIWGTAKHFMDLGEARSGPCETCGTDRPFHLVLHYGIAHVWYAFRCVTSREFRHACRVCGGGEKLETTATLRQLGKDPIDGFTRFGLAGVAAVVVGFIAFLGMWSPPPTDRYAEISTPRANDIYTMNVHRFDSASTAVPAFGLARVIRTDGTNVELAIPKATYMAAKDTSADVVSGAYKRTDYYEPRTVVIPTSRIRELAMDSSIVSWMRE